MAMDVGSLLLVFSYILSAPVLPLGAIWMSTVIATYVCFLLVPCRRGVIVPLSCRWDKESIEEITGRDPVVFPNGEQAEDAPGTSC